jgi:hypothetical protein
MDSEVPVTGGPCSESYEYDLPDADMLGPNYEAEETVEETAPVSPEEKKSNG